MENREELLNKISKEIKTIRMEQDKHYREAEETIKKIISENNLYKSGDRVQVKDSHSSHWRDAIVSHYNYSHNEGYTYSVLSIEENSLGRSLTYSEERVRYAN